MIESCTHLEIDNALCGKIVKQEDGYAEVLLHTTQQMRADVQGLVHGGFVFGVADYAAMCAVNDPFVVLGSANTTFISPVRVGDAVLCRARVVKSKGKKHTVEVEAKVENRTVFKGDFTTFVLPKHVLSE
jgi:acyl-coenzyme A thioesterase PaaI-like protein